MAMHFPTAANSQIRPIESVNAPPKGSPEWTAAETFGHYRVLPEQDVFRIFPKNRFGETVPVTVVRNFLHLLDGRSGSTITLKRYRHQGRWHYRDSRDQKSTSRKAIVGEVARLLFGGDAQQAGAMVDKHLG